MLLEINTFRIFFFFNERCNVAGAEHEQLVTPLRCRRVRGSGVCSRLRVMWAHCLHAVEISQRACV